MMTNLSKWLPARNFGPIAWLSFWNTNQNKANDSRRNEILEETKDLYWQYLGDGSMGYHYDNNWDSNLMEKTIQGNYRKENKVQIWIAIPGQRPQDYGFYKIIYDPANQKHSLSMHDTNANVLWNLGFSVNFAPHPMAINYK